MTSAFSKAADFWDWILEGLFGDMAGIFMRVFCSPMFEDFRYFTKYCD